MKSGWSSRNEPLVEEYLTRRRAPISQRPRFRRLADMVSDLQTSPVHPPHPVSSRSCHIRATAVSPLNLSCASCSPPTADPFPSSSEPVVCACPALPLQRTVSALHLASYPAAHPASHPAHHPASQLSSRPSLQLAPRHPASHVALHHAPHPASRLVDRSPSYLALPLAHRSRLHLQSQHDVSFSSCSLPPLLQLALHRHQQQSRKRRL